jgi:hypothetical protein
LLMEKAKKIENGHTLTFIPMPVINTDIKHFFFTSHRVIKDTSWQNMNTIYRKHQHFSVIFSSPVRSTEELMSSHVRRRRRPMLTFTFRSNVSDLYLCAMFLTVHDKLTCEDSST